MKVSVFESLTKPVPVGEKTFKEIFAGIISDTFKQQCADIQAEGNKKRRDKLKASLYSFTPTGRWKSREYLKDPSNWLESSGVICLDYDNQPLTPDLSERLRDDRFVFGFFKSPSYTGFKLLVKVNTQMCHHSLAFQQVADFYDYEYDLQHDKSGSDPPRLCFMSYDPHAYLNENSEVFTIDTDIDNGYKAIQDYPAAEGRAKSYNQTDIEAWVEYCERESINITEDLYSNYYRLAMALIRSEPKEVALVHFHRLCRMSAKYDGKHCDLKFKQCFTEVPVGKTITTGTLVWLARQSGFNLKLSGKKPSLTVDTEAVEGEEKEFTKFDFMRKFTERYRRNELTYDIEEDGKPLSEMELNSRFLTAQERFKGITKALWETWMTSWDDKIPVYNPLKEYFERVKNRKPDNALNRWIEGLNIVTGLKEGDFAPDFAQNTLRKWIIGIVAGVHGHLNVLMPILIGSGNLGKTEAFRRMLPGDLTAYFQPFTLDRNDEKSLKMQFCDSLVMLADEATFTDKAEAKEVRKLLSTDKVVYKPPYGRKNIQRQRLASLCGTSNHKTVIQDPKFNRRIIPLEVSQLKFDILDSIDRNDLMADAYQAFKRGETWELNKEEIGQLHDLQGDYSFIDTAKESILAYFEACDPKDPAVEWLPTMKIKAYLDGYSGKTFLSVDKIGAWLTDLGFVKEKRWDKDQKNSVGGYWVRKR